MQTSSYKTSVTIILSSLFYSIPSTVRHTFSTIPTIVTRSATSSKSYEVEASQCTAVARSY